MLRSLLVLALTATPALAQEATLSIDLAGAEDVNGACRLSFMAQNHLGADLSGLALEAVILTPEGKVGRLTLFDFRDLPQDRPRVRQFDMTGTPCAAIGRVLINGASKCDGVPEGACIRGLKLSTKVAQELIG